MEYRPKVPDATGNQGLRLNRVNQPTVRQRNDQKARRELEDTAIAVQNTSFVSKKSGGRNRNSPKSSPKGTPRISPKSSSNEIVNTNVTSAPASQEGDNEHLLSSESVMTSSSWSRSNPVISQPPTITDRSNDEERLLSFTRGCASGQVGPSRTSQPTVNKCYVRDLNPRTNIRRGGVILYSFYNDILYCGFGLDWRTHDLTPLAGGVSMKVDKSAVLGCIREYEEESLHLFNPLKESDLRDCPVLYDNTEMYIFLRIDLDPNEVSKRFNERYLATIKRRPGESLRTRKVPEVCGITWLSIEELKNSIEVPGVMYSRVRLFLKKAGDFYSIL